MLKALKQWFLSKKNSKKENNKDLLILEKASLHTLGDEGSWKEGKHGQRISK